jgi:hypothetical protein
MLQIHARVDIVDEARKRDWIVWGTSCKQGDRIYAELDTLDHRFYLDFPTNDGWSRPAAVDYSPSLAITGEPESCEFRFYRMAPAQSGEPLEAAPVWMADFCWTRGKPLDAGMAREGHCGFTRDAAPEAAFVIDAHEIKSTDSARGWTLDASFDLRLGKAVGQWKSIEIDASCTCGTERCKGSEVNPVKSREQFLWFAEPGEHARVGNAWQLQPGQQPSACQIEIGLRGPHPYADHGQWQSDHEVVARYCWRDNATHEGACD